LTTAAFSLENNNMRLLSLGDRHHAESSPSSAVGVAADHLIDAVDSRVDLARHTIAAVALALDLDAIVRHHITERRRRLQVNRVPANLEIGVAVVDSVGARDIGRPVAVRVGRGAPNTANLRADAGRVNVIVSRSPAPIIGTRNGKSGRLLDAGRNQHGLVARQHGLAERDLLAALVGRAHGAGPILAVRPVGERLADVAVVVAVQAAVGRQGIGV
jgi:hypothetical protein